MRLVVIVIWVLAENHDLDRVEGCVARPEALSNEMLDRVR